MSVSLQASVAHVVARLLARRATPQDEIPVLIRTVETALQALAAPAREAIEVEEPAAAAPAREAQEPRRRLRRARAATAPAELPPPVPAPPPQPRLVRRAELVHALRQEETPRLRPPHAAGALRGIVKWFDQRTRRGALRLPGCGEDVTVEPGMLDDLGVTRLYKGQEIEATLSDDPNPRVLRLAIPGGVWQVHSTGGVVRNRHHARPVVVELKREALRRVAARVEAEQLLGPTRAR